MLMFPAETSIVLLWKSQLCWRVDDRKLHAVMTGAKK